MKIYSRFDGSKVLFENESGTMKETVLAAVAASADLMYADLRYADLTYANLMSADLRYANLTSADLTSADLMYADLRYADLRYANLTYANLMSADLRYANLTSADLTSADLMYADLRYADLTSANLRSADLTSADLTSADLRSANLRSADLRYADLTSANLRSADLRYADLTSVKQDVWDVLLRAPNEIAGLLEALKTGKVNGSAYEGDCACLVGTIANVASCKYNSLEFIKPDSSRPAERWFLAIQPGHTPEKSPVTKLTVEWIEEFEKLLTRAVTLRTAVPQAI